MSTQKVQDDVVKSQPEISDDQIDALYDGAVMSLRETPEPRAHTQPTARHHSCSQFLRSQVKASSVSANKIPLLHLKRMSGTTWQYSSNLTQAGVYLDVLHEVATSGTTFKDKNDLLTGVGKGSIGVEILRDYCLVVCMW